MSDAEELCVSSLREPAVPQLDVRVNERKRVHFIVLVIGRHGCFEPKTSL